jgi:hypothetical protein
MLKSFLIGVQVFLLFGAVAASQSGQGEITGIVKDPAGSGVPNAPVSLINQETGVTRKAATDNEGRYLFAATPVGTYTVKVEATGFKPVSVTGIEVVIGAHIERDIPLAVGSVSESVIVSGEAPPIDTANNEVAGVVTQNQINTLPINTRQYLNLATLMPGTTQAASRTFYNSVQLGGGDHYYANGFQVDGVTNTWAEMGEPRQNFPEGSVQEFKVNTNQYKADSGLAMGGLVQVVTKSGTNEFHGEAFEYWRNRVLNRDNKFQQQAEQQQGTGKAPFNRNQFGGDIGGPIIHNKLHFHAAFEDTETANSFTLYVPPAVQPDYSSLIGVYRQPSHDRMLNLRGDYQITGKQRFFARYSQEWNLLTYQGCGGSIDQACYDGQIPRHSIVLGHTWTPKPELVNDFRFQYAFSSYELGPSGQPIWTQMGVYPAARLNLLQTQLTFPSFSYGYGYADVGVEKRYEGKDDVLWQKGPHAIKFGVDISRIPFADDAPVGVKGTYVFAHDHYFNPNDPASLAALATSNDATQFTASVPPVYTSVPTTQVGIYVQDDWLVRRGLTVSVGLRYDREFGSFNENLNPSSFPQPIPFLGDPSKRGAKKNFGPRVGFAWDVTGKSKDVIRGGFGIYYNNLQTLQNFPENRDLAQCAVLIKNPSFPDPYNGQSPTAFCSTAPPTVTVLAQNYRNPYSEQFNLGYSREILHDFSIHVDGVYTHSVGDYRTVDMNYPLTGANAAYGSLAGVRPLPSWARILDHEPISQSKYKGLYVRAEKRFARRYQFLASYTFSSCTDDNPQGSVINPANYRLDWGPCGVDQRHALVASGSVNLPGKVVFGAIWQMRSSLPFSALTAITDIDGNRQYVPGTSRNQGNRNLNFAAVNAYRATLGLPPVTAADIDSSRFNSFDVRVSRFFRVRENMNFELIGQIFNLFGTTNLSGANVPAQVNRADSTSFGKVLGASNLQQAELAARFVF